MPKNILLVEDDTSVGSAIHYLLENIGYAVTVAGDGEEAMARLSAGDHPQLILLDIHMPIMGGIEFRQKQLATETIKDIPVIFLTSDNRYRAQVEKLGAYDFLNKPIDVKDLEHVIHGFFYTAKSS